MITIITFCILELFYKTVNKTGHGTKYFVLNDYHLHI